MKIALVSDHSQDSLELARLTSQNRWDYSARHGYDLITLRQTYEVSFTHGLAHLLNILRAYDAVLKIGSDVVITNPAIAVEDFISRYPTASVLMSREIEGRSPINNDVAIWARSTPALELLGRLHTKQADWIKLPNYWQSYLAETPNLLAMVTVLAPRELNATDQSGEWAWEPGDFVCHCLGGTIESKVGRCAAVLEKL